jgi:hypothetical protein
MARNNLFEQIKQAREAKQPARENPYDGDNARRGPSAVGIYSSSNKVMTGSSTPLFARKRRKPHWK